MTYRGYEIVADVESIECWDIDESGGATEWIRDYDGFSIIDIVVLEKDGEGSRRIYEAIDLDDAKAKIDSLIAQAEGQAL